METRDERLLDKIGSNLRAERARRRLTQEAVASASGLATTQLARMERGETDSGISKYLRVAHAIGMDPADLFYGIVEINIDPDGAATDD